MAILIAFISKWSSPSSTLDICKTAAKLRAGKVWVSGRNAQAAQMFAQLWQGKSSF